MNQSDGRGARLNVDSGLQYARRPKCFGRPAGADAQAEGVGAARHMICGLVGP